MINKIILVSVMFLSVLSCSTKKDKSEEKDASQIFVSVVNYPLYYFTKAIGGEYVKVYLPAMNGDPAYWKPEARQVINFQNSDAIFINGAGYAKWIEKVSLPSSKIFSTSLNFKDQWIETQEELVHSHGAEGEHSHKGTAFTTWLNFSFASLQAQVIYQELIRLLPEYKDELQKNYEALNMSLVELDNKAHHIFEKLEGHTIMASHPVYQYLSSAYGIDMISMHWEPDEMPSPEMWIEFEKKIKNNGAFIMLWEDDPRSEIREKLDELNMNFTVFNPCARKPGEGNFIEVMRNNLAELDDTITTNLP